MLDGVLILTILTLLVTAIVGVALSRRRTDPCLKLWRGFPVRMALSDDNERRGRLRVFGNAFVLESLSGADPFGYVVHDDEYAALAILRRYVDDLAPDELRERQRRLQRVVRPGPFRRTARFLRNWANALRDALGEAVSTLARGTGTSGAQLKMVRESSVAALTTYYSPVLEAHLGRQVMVLITGGESERYEAVLHEYSGAFLCLLDATDADGARVDLILPRSRARVREIASQQAQSERVDEPRVSEPGNRRTSSSGSRQ